MAHQQTRPEGDSNGFAHYGAGDNGDHQNDRNKSRHADGPPDHETAGSASTLRGQQYEPQTDTHYVKVARPLRNDYRRLESVTSHPAFNTGPNSLNGAPHAPPHGGYAMRHSSGSPQAGQEQADEANRAEHAGNPSYTQPTWHPDEPYNAMGYVRRDGRVYDNDELYEEYRQNGQVGGLDENKSNSWSYL